MTDEFLHKAESIFHAALDRSLEERTSFIDAACAGDTALRAEVQSLIDHFAAAGDDFLAQPAFQPRIGRDFEIPDRIGKYRIVGRIGEGGMGVVFEAEQDTPRRRVALKVIRPGLHQPDVRRRFEAEAEVLARLHHPCIAHVYEAGVIEIGRDEGIPIPLPYFAMELVRGLPVHWWVREKSVPARNVVALMASVADAVEAAHQRGIIHRDLKPANILVGEAGQPKVLDFGMARVTDGGLRRTLHTGIGTLVGTLPYASPEQLWGDPAAIDTRTDVYSLGVVLLELLTGAPPVDVAGLPLPEAIRRLRETPLPRARQLNKRLSDELDTIVACATDADRTRRYASAGAFAADLRRYLRHEPIEAKRDSRWYVVRAQVRRYRAAFAAAAAFFVVLVAASVVGFSLYVRAARARHEATQQLWEAQLQQARAARESESIGRRARGLAALAAAAAIRRDRSLRDEAIACLALDDLELEHELHYEGVVATTRGLAHVDRYAESYPDGRVLVRALASGAVLTEISADPAPVGSSDHLLFDAAGRYLAVRAHDGNLWHLSIWDIAAGKQVLELADSEHAGRCFEFTRMAAGTDALVVAQADGWLRVLELPTGDVLASVETRPDPVRLAVDSRGQRTALSYRRSGVIDVFETATLARVATLDNNASGYALTFAGNDEWLFAGGSDFFVRIFAPPDSQPQFTIRGHQSAVVEAGSLIGTHLVATRAWDQTLRFWDCERGREMFSPVKNVGFDAASDRLVLRDPSGALEVWRYDRSREFITLVAGSDFGAPAAGRLFHRGTRLLTAGANGVLEWDVDTGALRRKYDSVPARDVFVVAARGKAVATTHRGIVEYDLRSAEAASRLLVDDGTFEGIDAHPDGWVAAGRQRVVTFDDTGIRRSLPGPAGANIVHVSADQRFTFIGSWHGEPARVVDNTSTAILCEFPGPDVRGAFDPQGRWLAVVEGVALRVVSMQTWQEHSRTPRGFRGSDLAGPAAFSPDGSLLAVAMDTYRVDLFETRSFQAIATLANPDFTAVSKLHFSEEGQRLVAIGTGTRAHVWDLGRLREQLRKVGLDWEG